MKKLYLLFAVAILMSCSKNNEFSGGWIWGGSFKYADVTKQELFVKQLEGLGIEHVTKDNGMITYKLSDLSKIRLVQDIVEGREENPPAFGKTTPTLPESEFSTLFEKGASEANIRIEYQNGSHNYFMWEFKHREQIYIIEQNVRLELHKTLMRQLSDNAVN